MFSSDTSSSPPPISFKITCILLSTLVKKLYWNTAMFTSCLWLLLDCNSRDESLTQNHGPQSLKYLLLGPLQKVCQPILDS